MLPNWREIKVSTYLLLILTCLLLANTVIKYKEFL